MVRHNCKFSARRPCCFVTFCPLIPAWATTIHKFQGFEAGKDPWDTVNNLVVEPGDVEFEKKTAVGLLYTAISRSKTIGSMTEDNPHPTDSSLFFMGEFNSNRVRHFSTHLDRKKKERVYNQNVIKRQEWVDYLIEKAVVTEEKKFGPERIREIELRIINDVVHRHYNSEDDLENDIAEILLNPNQTWKAMKNDFVIKRSFFD